MCDGERSWCPVIYEVIPGVVNVISVSALHIAVLCEVVLELYAGSDVVDAFHDVHLVSEGHGVYVTKVAVSERIQTE